MRGVLGRTEGGFVEAAKTRSAADLLAAFEAGGVPCDAVLCEDAMHRFFDDPLTLQLGLKTGIDQPTYGLVEQPGIFWDMGDTPIAITRACPDVGQHTDEIMAQLGFDATEIADFREKRIIA